MADRLRSEESRIIALLREWMDDDISIRELERRSGKYRGSWQRVFAGEGNLTFCALLEILDALEVDWADFFASAYKRADEGTGGLTEAEIDKRVNARVRAVIELLSAGSGKESEPAKRPEPRLTLPKKQR